VLGMFAPAFVTGHLIKRFGVTIIMAVGGLILLACGVINLSGVTLSHFLAGLFLLGVGWNFLFIGATTLVTEAYRPVEKAKTQGFNDVLVFGTVTITALSSGYLHEYYGWQLLNIALLPFVVLAIIAIMWLHRSRLSSSAVAIS
jgi:MFS family permease